MRATPSQGAFHQAVTAPIIGRRPGSHLHRGAKQASNSDKRTAPSVTGNPALRVAVLLFAVVVALVALRGTSGGSSGRVATDPRLFTGKSSRPALVRSWAPALPKTF